MKKIFALLLLLGFSVSAVFAAGGGIKPSDKQFRCFSKIGKTESTKKNMLGSYCLPKPTTENCNKEWVWSLDGKDDRVAEVGTDCPLQCQDNNFAIGTGSKNPFTTYKYCVRTSDWSKVAKCVDKQTGKDEIDTMKCERDADGTRYYWKPNCKADMTKDDCEKHLKGIKGLASGWRFCYTYTDPAPPANMPRNGNGQSVVFQEYINWQGTAAIPCEQSSDSPSGGWSDTSKPNPEKPDELGNLVILDEKDGNTNQIASKVHTKISGNSYNFRIFSIDSAGKFSSGISSLNCTITEKSGKSFSGQAKENSFFSALFSGKGKNFIFGEYTPESSGEASISCVGTSKDGKSVSAETTFFIAPNSYKFSTINAEFN
ncbi:hypothetical protein ACWIUD_08510, partial [Helicobacter sp. 23-1044]